MCRQLQTFYNWGRFGFFAEAGRKRTMAVLTAVELRHKRAVSWSKRADGGDLDAQFIFSWIAFNALYGQARYRDPDRQWSEIGDISKFLTLMTKLDRGIFGVLRERALAEHVSNLIKDKFLHDCC